MYDLIGITRKEWMVGTDVTKPILSDVAGSCPVSHQHNTVVHPTSSLE